MAYVKWLGHSSFEIYIDGYRVLVDPWLSNPLSPVGLDEYTGNVDLIVVTHDHGDHIGESVELLRRNPKAVFASVYEVANYVAEQVGASERIVGGNIGGPLRLPGIDLKVMFFPATHSCSRGTPTSVLIQGNEGSVYHAGDTGLVAEMALIGELYDVDVALLPIGSHFTMDAYQAAKAAEMLKAKVVIPMHYNTFPVIQADPRELEKYVKERGLETRVVILKPGEKFVFGKG
jgi:L-ascorbate metabolism protein UlaG (beta-lactamase superfamily)